MDRSVAKQIVSLTSNKIRQDSFAEGKYCGESIHFTKGSNTAEIVRCNGHTVSKEIVPVEYGVQQCLDENSVSPFQLFAMYYGCFDSDN